MDVKELFAGSVGGMVQVLTGQPFDTVKVRLQTTNNYKSMLDCVLQTYKTEGFRGFYKGTLTPLIGVGACVSLQFATLESAKRLFIHSNTHFNSSSPSTLTPIQLYLSGALSGLTNSILSGPIEHIRTRLQIQAKVITYTGPLDFLKKVYSAHGIRGVYKGQGITLVREFHGYGVYFATYEALMQQYMMELNVSRNEVGVGRQMVFGALSGYALWFMIYPIDAIKSKLQTDAFGKENQAYKGALDCARIVLQKEGIKGLYRGFWPCIIRAAPVNAATFVAYETTMNLIAR